jgi:threonine-phosphate decarboxylase
MTVHGGDVWKVGEELGIPASEILDFSANINPRGLPAKAQGRLLKDAANPKLLSFYPDPDAGSLRRALAKHLDCAPESIVVGPGAESLMAPIVRSLQVRRALIPIPAFSEYARVCQQEHIDFVPFALRRNEQFRVPVERFRARIETSKCDAALLNNPHNPSGSVLNKSEVQSILASTTSCAIPLILDEAFVDYAAHASLVREASETSGLIVIRSLTKFYGCPALRVGYAVAHPETIERVRELLPTWPVTQLALDALAEAISDSDYAESSLRENETERRRLCESLSNLGLRVFSSAANYLFVELSATMASSSELRFRLISRHRILIRNCDSYEGLETGRYVRVAVRSRSDNERLAHALHEELRVI